MGSGECVCTCIEYVTQRAVVNICLYTHIVCYIEGGGGYLFVHTYSMLYSGQW